MRDWPHAPIHRLDDAGAYMVTAGTYRRLHHFGGLDRLALLHDELLSAAARRDWRLQAWAVFSNHYHFVAVSSDRPESLRSLVREVHSVTARAVNTVDRCDGRRVWFEYWETRLTFQRSYLARLKYVHENPVRHGLVKSAADYRWCSANWFASNAAPAFFRTVMSLKTDRVKVGADEYEVQPVGDPEPPKGGGKPPHSKAG